jgi:hypothetical protein
MVVIVGGKEVTMIVSPLTRKLKALVDLKQDHETSL